MIPDLVRHAVDGVAQRVQADIFRKRGFRRHLLQGLVGLNLAFVDTARQLVQAPAVTAEIMRQLFHAVRGQVAHRLNAQLLEARLRHLAHPRHLAHRQGLQEFQHLGGPDHELAVGLVPV
ncbi:hypothetical protein D3C81_1761850 [compost metagenome]